jgi:response regulator RpfG family c-di-GMP phosphodiesterase
MSGWGFWLLLGVIVWLALALVATLFLARFFRVTRPATPGRTGEREAREPAPALTSEPLQPAAAEAHGRERRRILVVDDDAGIRLLLRTTLAADEFAVEEARSAEEAAAIARFWTPEVVILDIGLPGMDGLTLCRELKRNGAYGAPLVVLLTGADTTTEEVEAAGPDAVLHKPFSPLELVTLLDRVSEPAGGVVFGPAAPVGEQLLVYARDLSHLFEVERTQRRMLQHAYRQTVTALADALEAKDPVTGLHALRVQRYAVELVGGLDPGLLRDPSLEYGFLLHDVGKIGIPDTILQKEGSLTDAERRLMQRHTVIGVEMLSDVALLQGEGLRVVRSHHERWDGTGYPDRLAERQIPVGARIFALVDALDAMTSERPYRRALSWEEATDEILAKSGSQFDPRVVAAFATREGRLRRISKELAEAAA